MTSMRGWQTAALAAALLIGCGDNKKGEAVDGSTDASDLRVERGRYIMNNLGACTFCHTPLNPDGSRDNTKLLAGVNCFFDLDPSNPNVGCLSTRNLTNDATGLANATDTQIKDAIRNGNRTDGKTLVPVMPYWIFHNMTDSDVDAIIAYLRTVPGVPNPIAPNQPPWSMINDSGFPATPVDQADIPLPAPGPNAASAMRGRYLSSMAGLCMDCHTPELPPGPGTPIDMSKPYGGGRMFPREALGLVVAPGTTNPYPPLITTRNLTPHATGLMGWNVEQIKKAIAEGKDREGNAVCAATHGGLTSPYAALDPQDLTDIANYIASLPAVDNNTGTNCAGPPVP